MYNLDMDTAMALAWKREVDAELDEVHAILRKVDEVCKDLPCEEDTMMKTIYNVGTELSTRWTKLQGTFQEVQNQCEDIIKTISNAGEKGLENIEKYRNGAGFR